MNGGEGTQLKLALAGLAASLLAAFSLRPLIQGFAWAIPVLVICAVIVGIGIAVRQVVPESAWPAVLLAQVAGFALTVTTLFARNDAVLGLLPGPEAVNTVVGLLGDGADVTQRAAAPVPSSTSIVLLITGGIGLVALAVDVVAASLRRPAVAGLPLLAVYCVPAAVLPGGLGWVYFVLAALGFLVLVAVDSTERIAGWGRVLGQQSGGGTGALGGALSGGRRVTAVAVAAAVIVPLMVPGLGEQLLGNGNGDGPGRGNSKISVVNPILNLRQNLGSRSDTPVITYRTTTSEPEPLRIVSNDSFDGERWAPTTGSVSRRQRVQDGLAAPPGLAATVGTQVHQTEISIGNLKQTYLPLPYPSTRVEVEGDWLYESASLNVVGDGVFTNNLNYRASHLVVQPTREQLASAPSPPAQISGPFTQLPQGLPARVRRVAVDVAGRGDAYEQMVKLQEWFRSTGGFSYSEQPSGSDAEDSGTDAVLAFLEGKRGYCVQFASAMAVMARSLGVPARVGVGFLPGTQQADGSWQITLRDAHAWPEIFFQGVGWVRFEPTPAARVTQVPGYSLDPRRPDATPSAAPSASAGQPTSSAAASVAPRVRDPEQNAQAAAAESAGWSVPWRLIGALAVVIVLLMAPWASARLARWRRWRSAREPVQIAEAAWDDMRDRLADLQVQWAPAWTPRTLRERLVREHGVGGSARAALDRLVSDWEGVRFAPVGSRPARAAAQVRADVDVVVAAVAATLPAATRRRARWLPPSAAALWRSRRRGVGADAGAAARVRAVGERLRETVGSGRRGGP